MAIDTNIRVLIVDDQPGVRQIIADVLRAANFRNVAYAENGKVALKKMEDERPDVILLDWDMPIMTGYDFLKTVRGDSKNDLIPIIMLTAHNEEQDVVEAVSAGATSYILKPFAPDTLYKKLEQVLGDTIA